jgi:hypothetical protein
VLFALLHAQQIHADGQRFGASQEQSSGAMSFSEAVVHFSKASAPCASAVKLVSTTGSGALVLLTVSTPNCVTLAVKLQALALAGAPFAAQGPAAWSARQS